MESHAPSLEKDLGLFACSAPGEAQPSTPILLPRPGRWLWAEQWPLQTMKSTWRKWMRRNNYAEWKVTKLKWGRAVPLFSPGHYLRVVLSLRVVLCILASCSGLPRSVFASQVWSSLLLPHRDGPLDKMLKCVNLEKLILKRAKTAAFHL